MRCPVCGHQESKVIDSRNADSQNATRRRRECLQCGERFTTYERCEEQPLLVIKKDGSSEPFDHAKLRRGLMVAATKRPIAGSQIDELISDIETSLQNSFKYEIDSEQLGDMVLVRLKELDRVAYIRFASVYKNFQDLDEFTRELKNIG
ncbi:MAG: transcriptional repressor NrdR [Coriobacteriia bacterium]|nr:transcriptional repressor NrdR [Coriobacteriia bacterium]